MVQALTVSQFMGSVPVELRTSPHRPTPEPLEHPFLPVNASGCSNALCVITHRRDGLDTTTQLALPIQRGVCATACPATPGFLVPATWRW